MKRDSKFLKIKYGLDNLEKPPFKKKIDLK
ncbi:hypothetical protein [Borreliella valaisiana]